MKRLLTLTAAAALAAPAGAAAEGSWLAGDLHAHTTYSHDSYGGPGDDNTGPEDAFTFGHSVGSQFTVAGSRGLGFLAITDHNDVRSQADPGFGSMGVLGLPGYENSLRGHAQMLGARRVYSNGDSSAGAVAGLAAALRSDGGVFQVNHPAEGSTSFPDDIDWAYAFEVQPDTVEVWNISRLYQPPLPSGSSNDDAVRYWEGWLDRGARVAATGGSDNHYVATTPAQGVGQPTTWVRAEQRSVEGVLEGLRRGHTFISHQPPGLGGPRLFVEADGNGDGTFESVMGDAVRPGSALRARATGAAGSLMRVITDGGSQAFAPVPVGADGTLDHRFRLPAGATWVRAELFDPDLAGERGATCDGTVGSGTTYCRNLLLVLAMTSAVYMRPDAPVAPPAAGARGTARMSRLGRACHRRPFRATVRGRSIRRVRFSLDGRRLRRSSSRFSVRIRPDRLRPGRHRLAARVSFTDASRTRPRTLRSRFSVCTRPADRRATPRFTG